MHPIAVIKSSNTSADHFEQALGPFEDRQVFEGAFHALQVLDQEPVNVVIVEIDPDDMSALEIAHSIRDIDAEHGRFTWVILTGTQLPDELEEEFEDNIDAYVPLDNPTALRAAVRAGLRNAEYINDLSDANHALLTEREKLIHGQFLDPLTGLGNRRYAELQLDDSSRQIASRGGAVCFLLIEVGNYRHVYTEHSPTAADELIIAVSKRIRQLVRPLDIVTRFSINQFALVLLQASIEKCEPDCYERIFEGISFKSYQTSAGFLDARIGMSIASSLADTGAPEVQAMINTAETNMPTALETGTIVGEQLYLH